MMLVRDREKLSKVSGAGVEAAAAEPHVVKMSDGACIVIKDAMNKAGNCSCGLERSGLGSGRD